MRVVEKGWTRIKRKAVCCFKKRWVDEEWTLKKLGCTWRIKDSKWERWSLWEVKSILLGIDWGDSMRDVMIGLVELGVWRM